jgi:hypothetical protein
VRRISDRRRWDRRDRQPRISKRRRGGLACGRFAYGDDACVESMRDEMLVQVNGTRRSRGSESARWGTRYAGHENRRPGRSADACQQGRARSCTGMRAPSGPVAVGRFPSSAGRRFRQVAGCRAEPGLSVMSAPIMRRSDRGYQRCRRCSRPGASGMRLASGRGWLSRHQLTGAQRSRGRLAVSTEPNPRLLNDASASARPL